MASKCASSVQSFNRKERREQELERQRQEAEELLNQPAKKESEKMKVRHEGGIVIQGWTTY